MKENGIRVVVTADNGETARLPLNLIGKFLDERAGKPEIKPRMTEQELAQNNAKLAALLGV